MFKYSVCTHTEYGKSIARDIAIVKDILYREIKTVNVHKSYY